MPIEEKIIVREVGPPGSPGVHLQDPLAWQPDVEYPRRSAVTHEGSLWWTRLGADVGEEPGVSGSWEALVEQGAKGDKGDTGEKGDTGDLGLGVADPVKWDAGAVYPERSVVEHRGSAWYAALGAGVGEEPGVHAAWTLFTRGVAEQQIGIPVSEPFSSERRELFKFNRAWRVVKIVSVVRGGSTPSASWTLRYATDISTAGTEIKVGGITTTNTTTGQSETVFNNAEIPADAYVWLHVSAVTNTAMLHITLLLEPVSDA